MAYGSIGYSDQDVFIHGERLRGVQSCTAGWTPQEGFVNAIGIGFTGSVEMEASLQSSFDVSRLMVGPHDPLVDCLNSTNVEGEIAYGSGKNFAFERGFVSSYSCACAVGEIPSLDFGIIAFGRSGGGQVAVAQTPPVDDTIMVAHPGSITLDVAGHSTNRIQSFDVSININREPLNLTGALTPDDFILQLPLEVDCQFVMHVDDYESSKMFDFVCSPERQDLNFIFNDCDKETLIRKFFIKDARLVDFQQTGGIGDSLEATLTYKSLLNDASLLRDVVTGSAF